MSHKLDSLFRGAAKAVDILLEEVLKTESIEVTDEIKECVFRIKRDIGMIINWIG